MKIKKWKDGTYRYGRKIVAMLFEGIWIYKKTGRLVIEKEIKK
jgi:hypothetical protein